ncbi:hypothetical protein F5887DRAFT_501496 [Amanita rubescens]|nr:hypothetical protein F5887DRAFT_501496 [Amanita rubescens]
MARLTPPSTRNSQASSPISSPSSPSSSGRSRNRTSLPPPPQEQPLSGSETERESFYTHHTNISSPSLSHMANSAQTSTATYQTPPPRSNHHRIASLSSASLSTPYLPSTSRVFQTPPPHAQPLTKTRSTGGANTTPSSGSGSRTRLTLASTSSSSTSKSKEDKPTTGSPKRRRISGSGGSVLTTPSVASTSSEVNGEDPRSQVRRNNAIREEETDVVQAALAAVASSRSGQLVGREKASRST